MRIRVLKIVFLCCLGSLFSCHKKDYVLENRTGPGIGVNNALILGSEFISRNGKDLYVDLKIGIVGSRKHTDITSIPNGAFKNITGSSYDLIVESVTQTSQVNDVPYSNLLALDITGDWDSDDAFNMRTTALNKTLIETYENEDNEIALATFSSNEKPSDVWFWSDGDPYHQSYEDMGKILTYIYSLTGDDKNLYDAINNLLDYANENSKHENKNITIVCRNYPDQNNENSHFDIISKAKEYGVKVNMIILGAEYDWNMMSIPIKTGGFINMITSTSEFELTLGGIMDKGAPILGSIDRILSQNMNYYKVSIRLEKKFGIWSGSNNVSSFYEVNLNYNDGTHRLNNIIPFYVDVP